MMASLVLGITGGGFILGKPTRASKVNNMPIEKREERTMTSIQVDISRISQNQTSFPPTINFSLFLFPSSPNYTQTSLSPQTIGTPLSLLTYLQNKIKQNKTQKMYPCRRCRRNIGIGTCPFCGYTDAQPFSQIYNPPQNPWSQPYIHPHRMHLNGVNGRTADWIDRLETGYDEFGDPIGRIYKGHGGRGCHYPPMY